MVLHAQGRGEDINNVFGGNCKEICDNIIAELPEKTTKQKILEGANTALMCVWVIGAIYVIKQAIACMFIEPRNFVFTLSTGDILNALLIIIASVSIVKYICRNSFDSDEDAKKKSIMDNKVLGFIVIWGAIMIALLILIGISYVLSKSILTVPLYMAIIFTVIVFIAERIMTRLI
ncbi:MAG: hypothetical protein ACI4PU_07775 [Intestinibacter sp.]